MNQSRDLDALIATWLDEGPDTLPAETRRAIAVGLRTQPRTRRMAILGGSTMSPINRIAAAAAVLLAVGGLSAFVLSNRTSGPGATAAPSVSAAPAATPSLSPSPSATASASVAPTPTATPPSTAGWLQFTSSHYGYAIAYPPTWVATQAARAWVSTTDPLAAPGPGGVSDVFLGYPPNGPETGVFGFAADVPAGTSQDTWLASYYAGRNYCPTMPTFVPITVDGRPGKLDPCYDAQAFVFVGNRVYVFVIFQEQEQPLFRAFLSTVRFPVNVSSGSPAPSASPS